MEEKMVNLSLNNDFKKIIKDIITAIADGSIEHIISDEYIEYISQLSDYDKLIIKHIYSIIKEQIEDINDDIENTIDVHEDAIDELNDIASENSDNILILNKLLNTL